MPTSGLRSKPRSGVVEPDAGPMSALRSKRRPIDVASDGSPVSVRSRRRPSEVTPEAPVSAVKSKQRRAPESASDAPPASQRRPTLMQGTNSVQMRTLILEAARHLPAGFHLSHLEEHLGTSAGLRSPIRMLLNEGKLMRRMGNNSKSEYWLPGSSPQPGPLSSWMSAPSREQRALQDAVYRKIARAAEGILAPELKLLTKSRAALRMALKRLVMERKVIKTRHLGIERYHLPA